MIDRLALNVKVGSAQGSSSGSSGTSGAGTGSTENYAKMVAIAASHCVYMWGVSDEGTRSDIGKL